MAQFERKQTVQRIKASILARSQRGLYNGGCVPLGYKLIPEKRGYLAIDPIGAKLVRECFTTFLKAGTLTKTAQMLNARGFVVKKEKEGGGGNKRLGIFTFDNVYNILTNKMYIGIKTYEDKGVEVESKVVWDAIITEAEFKKANALLKKNYRRNRKAQKNRYPYLLTGLVKCAACGEALWGKSAHGNGGKVPYYEHGNVSKLETVSGHVKKCSPHGFSGKKIEEKVWSEVKKLIAEPGLAKEIMDIAHKKYKRQDKAHEIKVLKTKAEGVQGQIDSLIERISELPKTLPATSFYTQIEKLETQKEQLQRQRVFQEQSENQDMPMGLKDYSVFLKGVMRLGPEARVQIVERLIHKVELAADKVKVHYYVGVKKNRDPHFFMGHGSNSIDVGGHGKNGLGLLPSPPRYHSGLTRKNIILIFL